MDGSALRVAAGLFCLLAGDPRTDGPFTFRMRMPAAWAMRPHQHDAVEHITVLTGTLEMRFGPNESHVPLPTGSFVSIPVGTPMSARGRATGPW